MLWGEKKSPVPANTNTIWRENHPCIPVDNLGPLESFGNVLKHQGQSGNTSEWKLLKIRVCVVNPSILDASLLLIFPEQSIIRLIIIDTVFS